MTKFYDWFRKNAKPDRDGNLSVSVEELYKAFPGMVEGLQNEADRQEKHKGEARRRSEQKTSHFLKQCPNAFVSPVYAVSPMELEHACYVDNDDIRINYCDNCGAKLVKIPFSDEDYRRITWSR